MRKIGIVTITRGQNYGNKLQNYAVQEVLKKLNCDPVTIINNTKKGFKKPIAVSGYLKKLNPIYVLKVIQTRLKNKFYLKNDNDSLIRSYLWLKKFKNEIKKTHNQRIIAFSDFSNQFIKQSAITISVDNYNIKALKEFDFFVCGSDQVWNPYYPHTSAIDFLQFAQAEKRIAYAPSFGVSRIPDNKKEVYSKWISEIPHLSVREDKGALIIKELTGRDAEVLVDPTLMLSAEEWLAIAKKTDFDVPEKFILTYFLGNQKRKYKRFIQNQADRLNCKIINLNEIREFDHFSVDPSGFIYLINKATLVCTDSFHGAVLSIILKRNFVVFDRVEDGHSMSSRMETLLKKFGLESRLFIDLRTDLIIEHDYLDYENEILIKEQNKAFKFLKAALDIQ